MSSTTLVFITFYVEINLGLKFWFEPVPHTYIQRTFVIVVLPTFSQVCSGLRSAACVFLRFETMNTACNLLDVLFSNQPGRQYLMASMGNRPEANREQPSTSSSCQELRIYHYIRACSVKLMQDKHCNKYIWIKKVNLHTLSELHVSS